MNALPVHGAQDKAQESSVFYSHFFDLTNINENRHLKFKDRW